MKTHFLFLNLFSISALNKIKRKESLYYYLPGAHIVPKYIQLKLSICVNVLLFLLSWHQSTLVLSLTKAPSPKVYLDWLLRPLINTHGSLIADVS